MLMALAVSEAAVSGLGPDDPREVGIVHPAWKGEATRSIETYCGRVSYWV